MAKVNQRLWKAPGQRAKRRAWGYTVQVDGKQRKAYRAEWTREDAEKALAALLLKIEQPQKPAAGITFGEAIERYFAAKSRKRSLAHDARILKHLAGFFGADTPLGGITAARIADYKGKRLATTSPKTSEPLAAGTINRALSILRHLLRTAHDEWEVLPGVPRIKLEKEPHGRVRWLTPEEGRRLLDACRESRNADLLDLAEFSLFTGLRRGEALGLTWDRVDRSRGIILLDVTKSGKRREVPLNSEADAVVARRGPRDAGPVFCSRWDRYRTAWENAVKRAKLSDFHWHDLRHTFASWAVQRGAKLQEVKELLGHHSLAMVLRYAHLSPEHLRSAVARLDGALAVRPAEVSAQGSAQEPADLGGAFSKSS